jgi:hypothetical protein
MLQDMESTYKMLLNGLTQFADNVAVNSGRLVIPAAKDAYIDMNDLKRLDISSDHIIESQKIRESKKRLAFLLLFIV